MKAPTLPWGPQSLDRLKSLFQRFSRCQRLYPFINDFPCHALAPPSHCLALLPSKYWIGVWGRGVLFVWVIPSPLSSADVAAAPNLLRQQGFGAGLQCWSPSPV